MNLLESIEVKMRTLFSFITLILLVLTTSMVNAKDLTHRLGLGLKNNTSESLPSLAAAYYYSKNYAFTGSLGMDTKKNYNSMQLSAGVRKMIYFEDQLNFYMSAQLGMISSENPVDGKANGIEMLALFGTEFFFAGLDSLGFTLEAGVGVSTLRNTRVRTVADDPLRAGILFYF